MLYTLFVPHSELINLIINDGNRTECRRGSRIWKWGVRNQILFQYLRDKKKKKEGGSEKGGGGENSPISPPLDPRLSVPL